MSNHRKEMLVRLQCYPKTLMEVSLAIACKSLIVALDQLWFTGIGISMITICILTIGISTPTSRYEE